MANDVNALDSINTFFDNVETDIESSEETVREAQEFIGEVEQTRAEAKQDVTDEEVHAITLIQQEADANRAEIDEVADTAIEKAETRIEEIRTQQIELVKALVVRPLRLIGRTIRRVIGF